MSSEWKYQQNILVKLSNHSRNRINLVMNKQNRLLPVPIFISMLILPVKRMLLNVSPQTARIVIVSWSIHCLHAHCTSTLAHSTKKFTSSFDTFPTRIKRCCLPGIVFKKGWHFSRQNISSKTELQIKIAVISNSYKYVYSLEERMLT